VGILFVIKIIGIR